MVEEEYVPREDIVIGVVKMMSGTRFLLFIVKTVL